MSSATEKPILFSAPMVRAILDGKKTQTRRVVKPGLEPAKYWNYQELCPYGVAGTRLWVRETWQPIEDGLTARYRADMDWDGGGFWKPSIHMPRWASRITLEVCSVRVERLQEISAEDCIAEGLSTNLREHDAVCHLREQYRDLWNSINAKRGYGWDTDPFVWVVEFREVGK